MNGQQLSPAVAASSASSGPSLLPLPLPLPLPLFRPLPRLPSLAEPVRLVSAIRVRAVADACKRSGSSPRRGPVDAYVRGLQPLTAKRDFPPAFKSSVSWYQCTTHTHTPVHAPLRTRTGVSHALERGVAQATIRPGRIGSRAQCWAGACRPAGGALRALARAPGALEHVVRHRHILMT